MEFLKVSSRSNPNSVAGAIAGVVRQDGAVEVQVVGAGALNQAIKAVAIARTYVEDSDIDLVCTPSFADVEIDGQERTAIRLRLDNRAAGSQPVPAAAPLDLTDEASEPVAPAAGEGPATRRRLLSPFAGRR